jgi:hypothetical protein
MRLEAARMKPDVAGTLQWPIHQDARSAFYLGFKGMKTCIRGPLLRAYILPGNDGSDLITKYRPVRPVAWACDARIAALRWMAVLERSMHTFTE